MATTPTPTPPTGSAVVAKIDQIVSQAQAFEPLLLALLTQFIPSAAIYLPEIQAILTAILSASNKATGTTPPPAPAPTP